MLGGWVRDSSHHQLVECQVQGRAGTQEVGCCSRVREGGSRLLPPVVDQAGQPPLIGRSLRAHRHVGGENSRSPPAQSLGAVIEGRTASTMRSGRALSNGMPVTSSR
jgi:hypothetical protein